MKNNPLINQSIDEYLNTIENAPIKDALTYILKNNGKLLRPNLLLACAEHFGLPITQYVHLAVALEMIHTYSLIHDDLPCMDNDDYRRGKLTLHKVYDEAFALLMGDILLSDAFKVATLDHHGEDVIALLSTLIGSQGMALGQVMDMRASSSLCSEDIKKMYRLKTGKLFAFALTSVPMSLHLPIDDFEELGYLLGVCFQLKDDIDDYNMEHDLGKQTIIVSDSIEENKKQMALLQSKIHELVEKLKINESEFLYQIIQKIAF